MAYSESIGQARLESLLPDIQNQLNRSMMRVLGTETTDRITAKSGSLYYEPVQSSRAALNDARNSKVGFGNDALLINSKTASRTYDCDRFAVAEGFDMGLEADVVYSQLRARVNDRLLERITLDQDEQLLFPILRGTGTAADSRNVTAVDQTGTLFSSDSTDVIGILDARAELHGSTRLVLSTDAARTLRDHAQFKALSPLGHSGRLSHDALVDVLMGHITNINQVIIGNRVYQDGSMHLAADITRSLSGVTYMDDGRNIVIVPFGPRKQDFDEQKLKGLEFYIMEELLDCIAMDPFRSVAFTNAYA